MKPEERDPLENLTIAILVEELTREETQGEMADGLKYWRVGTLGCSNIDEAYEWITQDGINSNMMIVTRHHVKCRLGDRQLVQAGQLPLRSIHL